MGAIERAGGWGPLLDVKLAFDKANNITAVTLWNDNPMRTKEEVIQAFDKAIEQC